MLKKITGLVGLLVLSVWTATASASLIGQEIRFQTGITDDTFTVTEGLGPELNLFGQLEVDIEESSLRATWLITGTIGGINPMIWSQLSWGEPGEIVGATIDLASTWSISDTPTFTESSVSLTTTDFNVTAGDFVLINLDVIHDVPTPATLALFGLGLAGLGWSRRKQTS